MPLHCMLILSVLTVITRCGENPTGPYQGTLMTSVPLAVKGPAAGRLPVLRKSVNRTVSRPELLVILVLKELPGATNELRRVKPAARSGLLVARALELNEEAVPSNLISMGESIPASGHE